jgi:hypothetical protein
MLLLTPQNPLSPIKCCVCTTQPCAIPDISNTKSTWQRTAHACIQTTECRLVLWGCFEGISWQHC